MKNSVVSCKWLSRAVVILLPAFMSLSSCKEKIDDSDFYTFTGEMMTDHFVNNPDTYSSYLSLLERVRPGNRSQSTVAALLSARGNYTCFAPTNEAIVTYIDSLYALNQLSSRELVELPDSIARDIVFNSLIDTEREEAFLSTQFEEGVLASNMNDRPMTIAFTNEEDGTSAILVNTRSKIIVKDTEVENGYIHTVDRVIAPSNSFISGLIGDAENTKIFAYLLTATAWDEQMMRYRDDEYEENHPETRPGVGSESETFACPEHKYYGHTVFVETDDVFQQYGIVFDELNPHLAVEKLKEVLIGMGVYSSATTDNDYTNQDNIINQFVSYHLLPMRIPYNQLAIHYNEYGYNGGSYTVNTFDYYETMAHRRLMKITSGPRTGGYRINRYAILNTDNFRELSVEIEGTLISATNEGFESNALNGYYYPINQLLVYTDDVPNKVLNERMRFDFASLLPELMTNNLRRPMSNARNISFPNNFFDELDFDDDTTVFTYLPGLNSGWQNYQGDEFNIVKQYDFTVKLPPVPYAGMYELRFACNNNSSLRGMAQFYLGENKNNLVAVGVPIDLRIRADADFVGYTSANTDANLRDDELIEEHDRMMSNNGYMKAPKYFTPAVGGSTPARDYQSVFRKILYKGHFEPNKTYYMRFKTVLEDPSRQFVLDYIEFCPRSIYDGTEAEDRW